MERKERREFNEKLSKVDLSEIKIKLLNGTLNIKQFADLLNISKASVLFRNLVKTLDVKLQSTQLKSTRFDYLYSQNINDYWNNEELVNMLKTRLENPVINKSSDTNHRYVITFKNHPRASKVYQVKAHIIMWEIHNKQYFPDNYGIWFKDRNQLNIKIDNLEALPLSEIKSRLQTMENNNFWKGGNSIYGNYLGGWKKKSKIQILNTPYCKVCNTTTDLVVHHVLLYSLFNCKINANCDENLIVVCRHCHGKIHYDKINIWRHIEEIQYEKLLKLLERLKSQSSGIDVEILSIIEKQIEQTENQQPSILTCNDEDKGSETISKESRIEDNSKKEDSIL